MKLWLVQAQEDHPAWRNPCDKFDGAVIAAKTEAEARQIMAERPGDEGAAVWLDPAATDCVEIAKRTSWPAGCVLASFNAG